MKQQLAVFATAVVLLLFCEVKQGRQASLNRVSGACWESRDVAPKGLGPGSSRAHV